MAIDETPVCAKPYTGFDKVSSTQIFTLINPNKKYPLQSHHNCQVHVQYKW